MLKIAKCSVELDSIQWHINLEIFPHSQTYKLEFISKFLCSIKLKPAFSEYS